MYSVQKVYIKICTVSSVCIENVLTAVDELHVVPSQVTQDVFSTTTTENQDVGDTHTGFESILEHSRRVRMSQSARDDVVANSKSHRKRRKGKGKKFSSATSMCQYVLSMTSGM